MSPKSLVVIDVDCFIVGHTIKRCTQPAADAGDGGFDNGDSYGQQPSANGSGNPAASSAAGKVDTPVSAPAGSWAAAPAAPADDW